MKNIVYLIIGCFLCVSCGDFLKEYSKDLTYASSCKDLDEVMIGNGYMKSDATSSLSSSLISQSTLYYPWLFVMDDDVEEFATGVYKVTSEGPLTLMRPFYGWQKKTFQTIKGVLYDDPCWKKLYEHIGYLNVILSEIKEFSHEPEEDRNRITGEAEFLRGAYYYLLVNMYAKPYVKATASSDMGVPLNITEKIEDKYFSRESVETIYKQIVKDLKNAVDHLAGIQQATIYRVNETAARILLSRVYLYMGEWELAEVECEKAIQAGCPLWDLNGVDMTDNGSESTGNLKQQYMISATSPEVLFTQGMNVMNLLMYDGTNVGRFKASDELLQLYSKYSGEGITDLRMTGYFSVSRKKSDCYFSRKTSVLAKDIKAFDAFVIRSAEAYLNKAEAQAMQGKSEAIQTLKTLLENRFENGEIPTSIDGLQGENLVRFIREERRRELCFECHRWFDLRRYAVCEKYPEKKEVRHALYAPATVSNGMGVYEGEYVLKPYGEDAAWLMPIPDYEITYNKGEMKQNDEREERGIQ